MKDEKVTESKAGETKKRIHVRLGEWLLEGIKEVQAATGLDRSRAIEHMLTGDLARRRWRDGVSGQGLGAREITPIQESIWRRIRAKEIPVRVVVMNGGVLPKRATAGSAGYDLCASEDMVLPSQVPVAVGVGLRVELPAGYELQIRARSGLALRQGITVLNGPGTIDADFRGEVKVILFNTQLVPQRVEKGDRIAQGLVAPVWNVDWIEAGSVADTERGEGGFGSTGKGESDV